MSSTPGVIVVGAGPVGMTAALSLASRGLRVTIVERKQAPQDEPKAISLDDESLRLFQAIGIVDEVLSIIVPGTGTVYYGADDRPLFHARGGRPYRLGFPFKNPFAQPDLERVLRDAITASPNIDLRFGAEVVALEQDTEGVTVTVETVGAAEQLHADALVGADGGRSTVRRLSSIGMLGRSFDDAWLVVDTLGDDRRERYGMHHGDPARPHVIVPGLDGRCRYEFRLTAAEAAAVGTMPSFELIRALVRRYRELEPHQVERAVVYTFHALVAERWRDGRVFLAGDAAHMMPPFAGQGLNSGMRDVANLTWKLADALTNDRGEDFLDSYEAERRPHAEAVVAGSVLLGRIVMTPHPRVAAHRDALVRRALETPDGRAYFEEMRYRPANVLRAGLVDPGAPGAGVAIAQPTVFDFLAHRVVALDALLGTGWSVLAVGVQPHQVELATVALRFLAPTFVAVPLDDLIDSFPQGVAVALDLDGRLSDEVASARGTYLLLRPDRFVATQWAPGEEASIVRLVERWLHEPTPGAALAAAGISASQPLPMHDLRETQWSVQHE